jgi:hypothetical protein
LQIGIPAEYQSYRRQINCSEAEVGGIHFLSDGKTGRESFQWIAASLMARAMMIAADACGGIAGKFLMSMAKVIAPQREAVA